MTFAGVGSYHEPSPRIRWVTITTESRTNTCA